MCRAISRDQSTEGSATSAARNVAVHWRARKMVHGSPSSARIAGSTEGWFGGKLALPLRVLLFGAALCLIHPGTVTDLIGLGIAVPIYAWQRWRQPAAA